MNQLDVLASELHEEAVAAYKVAERFAYKFIMSVKRIRDERLYKQLGFQSFDSYCELSWNTTRDYMDQRIQIASAFGENFDDTYRQLGHSKSLILARMEPAIRNKVESTADVNDVTVRQLKELERKAKESEARAKTAKEQADRYAAELRNRPVIEKPVSMPSDRARINELESQVRNLNQRLETASQQIENAEKLRKMYEKDSKEYQELKSKIEFLNRERNDLHRQIESATALSGMAVEIDNFLKTKLSPIRYSRALERMDSEVAVRNLTEILDSVEMWLNDMRRFLPNSRKVVIDYDPTG